MGECCRTPPRRAGGAGELEPVFLAEVEKHSQGDDAHQGEREEVARGPFELRHVAEVHSIDTRDEGEGNKNRRDDGKGFHYLVHAVVDAGEVDVNHS